MEKRSSELLLFARERVAEQFPNAKFEMISAYWSDLREFPCNDVSGHYRCSLYINDRLAFGYGETMNECCDKLLESAQLESAQLEWERIEWGIEGKELVRLIKQKKVKEKYETACNEYLRLFCEKHGFEFKPDSWVAGDVGGIADVSDFWVDVETIRADIDLDAPEKDFLKWYDHCSRYTNLNLPIPNFKEWIKDCPRMTDEELEQRERERERENENSELPF